MGAEQFFSAARHTLSHIIFIIMKIICDKVCLATKKSVLNIRLTAVAQLF